MSAENEPKLYICRLKDPLKLCRAEENCRGEWSNKSTDSKWSEFWNNLERWQNSVTSHRCTSVGPDASFFIKYLSMRIWLFLHRVDLCVAFYIWQDIHWVLYNALALVLLPIWWPTCLPVLWPEFALAVLPLLKCSRSACLSLIPCLQRSSWLKSVKCHRGVISSCWRCCYCLQRQSDTKGNVSDAGLCILEKSYLWKYVNLRCVCCSWYTMQYWTMMEDEWRMTCG